MKDRKQDYLFVLYICTTRERVTIKLEEEEKKIYIKNEIKLIKKKKEK